MKSLVMSAILCAATVGSSVASTYTASHTTEHRTERTIDQKTVAAFKELIGFHRRNVTVLWNQYGLAEARIRETRGNHAELNRDKAFFVGVYQQDINKGIRVEQSKKAIAEIEAMYIEKHAQRNAYEHKEIAKLQAMLQLELQKEKKKFDKAKKRNAALINDETLPLLREAEAQFSEAIARANSLDTLSAAVAAR